MKRLLLCATLTLGICTTASADEPMKIVTTLSTYADIAKSIGGDAVETSSVASPRFNPHFIEPRPSDVLKLKRAQLFIHSGLDLEAWRGPLVDAAGRADIRSGGSAQLDLSTGITILEKPTGTLSRAEGDIHVFGNPHYWIDPRNGEIIAQEITAKLTELAPNKSEVFKSNLAKFTAELHSKMIEWTNLAAKFKNQEVIGYHNEWIYLTNYLGLHMHEFLEPKPGIPPSPKHIEYLSAYGKEHKIKGIIQATFYPLDAANAVAGNIGAKVLLLCQGVGELPQASTYISMLDYNIHQIAGALSNG